MPISIPTERLQLAIDGVVESADYGGTSLPISVDDGAPFSIDVVLEFDETFTQCSPCVGTGDKSWRGRVTEFSIALDGMQFTADVTGVIPYFASTSYGDDDSETDHLNFRLGSALGVGVQTPLQLHHDGEVYASQFNFALTDYWGEFYDTKPDAWRDPKTPSLNTSINVSLLMGLPLNNPVAGVRFELDPIHFRSVPTPSALLLLTLGLFGIGIQRSSKRRRRTSANRFIFQSS